MLSYLLIWIIVLIVGTIICFKILKSIAKTLVIAGFILLLFFAITTTLTYSDMQELKQELADRENVYFIQTDNNLVFSTAQYGEEYKELIIDNVEFNEEYYEDLLNSNDYYKIIIINTIIYDPLEEKTALLSIVSDSSMPFEARADALDELNKNLKEQEGTHYLIQEYKNKSIEVYPKTMMFWLIGTTPQTWLNKLS
ncbi:hypothetical protein COV16_04370 [Candidatus Woesearchaeota archaeon CG10_big_fil_rev_8_21_14_0_10_34_8]|nr:MAG: hypothetical protein COV16_04370 [Candidatus Woesearchaeota archaeon CG10_big_fil_rev_8_21_14_0_10_34_8]